MSTASGPTDPTVLKASKDRLDAERAAFASVRAAVLDEGSPLSAEAAYEKVFGLLRDSADRIESSYEYLQSLRTTASTQTDREVSLAIFDQLARTTRVSTGCWLALAAASQWMLIKRAALGEAKSNVEIMQRYVQEDFMGLRGTLHTADAMKALLEEFQKANDAALGSVRQPPTAWPSLSLEPEPAPEPEPEPEPEPAADPPSPPLPDEDSSPPAAEPPPPPVVTRLASDVYDKEYVGRFTDIIDSASATWMLLNDDSVEESVAKKRRASFDYFTEQDGDRDVLARAASNHGGSDNLWAEAVTKVTGVRLPSSPSTASGTLKLIEMLAAFRQVSHVFKVQYAELDEDTRARVDSNVGLEDTVDPEFSNGSPLARAMARLREHVSGGVRVVVRIKDTDSTEDSALDITRMPARVELTTNIPWRVGKHASREVVAGGGEESKKYKYGFGPFFAVSSQENASNSLFAEKHLEVGRLARMLDEHGDNLCLFTYGYSGSGKTYTLFGDMLSSADPMQEMPREGGAISHLVTQLVAAGYEGRVVDTACVYGYTKSTKIRTLTARNEFAMVNGVEFAEPNISQESFDDKAEFSRTALGILNDLKQKVGKAMRGSGGDDGGQKLSAFIKSTPNNPESSRGFMIVRLEVRKESGGSKYIVVVDMAGNEDPMDILLAMSPCSYIPSAINKGRNILVSDDVFYTHAAMNVVKEKVASVMSVMTIQLNKNIRNLVEALSTATLENETKMGNARKYMSELFKDLPVYERWTSDKPGIDAITQLRKTVSIAFEASVLRWLEKVNATVPKEVYSGKLGKRDKLISDFANSHGIHLDKITAGLEDAGITYFKITENETPDKNLVINIVAETFGDFAADVVSSSPDYVARKTTLAPEGFKLLFAKMMDKGSSEEDKKKVVEDITKEAKSNFVNSPVRQLRLVRDDLRPLRALTTVRLQSYESIRSNAKKDPKKAKSNESVSFSPMKMHGEVLCVVDGKEYPWEVVERIIHEGYYINQANAELMTWLGDGAAYAKRERNSSCKVPVESLYAENYDVYADLPPTSCDTSSSSSNNKPDRVHFSSLVPTIQKMALPKPDSKCKFVLVAALRKEKEARFRLGAIDTMNLVSGLVS